MVLIDIVPGLAK
jgi:hypothetical protein